MDHNFFHISYQMHQQSHQRLKNSDFMAIFLQRISVLIQNLYFYHFWKVFKVLYFQKMCLIFVSFVDNFVKRCVKLFFAWPITIKCTEVRFASFLSGGFTTMPVINPPERKLAKRTSVHWFKIYKIVSILQNCFVFVLTKYEVD